MGENKMKKGLVQVYTGDGKGKTTAAFGVAMRMLGHGRRVAIVQFFKYLPKSKALDKEGAFPAMRKSSGKLKIWSFGGGFTWKVSRELNQRAIDRSWKKCCQLLRDPKYSLVIFDEINIALKYKFLKTSEVLAALKRKTSAQNVILTGRGAPQSLISAADLVTEMKCVKHPFRKGILAQPGLDF